VVLVDCVVVVEDDDIWGPVVVDEGEGESGIFVTVDDEDVEKYNEVILGIV